MISVSVLAQFIFLKGEIQNTGKRYLLSFLKKTIEKGIVVKFLKHKCFQIIVSSKGNIHAVSFNF